jgi:hypothetical protein
MTEKKEGWWSKFTGIVLYTLPFGNDGRGTEIRLFAILLPVLMWVALVVYDLVFVV